MGLIMHARVHVGHRLVNVLVLAMPAQAQPDAHGHESPRGISRLTPKSRSSAKQSRTLSFHSHSMVPGGFEVTS